MVIAVNKRTGDRHLIAGARLTSPAQIIAPYQHLDTGSPLVFLFSPDQFLFCYRPKKQWKFRYPTVEEIQITHNERLTDEGGKEGNCYDEFDF
jgi:hypothetical protein